MTRLFRTISSEVKYENPWLKVVEYKTNTDGKEGIYGVVERPNSVTMIVESNEGKLLFVRQYRYPTKSYSWELPMGGIDEGEIPQAGALRELEEEVGCSINLKKIGEFHPVPGLTPQIAYVYYARISDKDVTRVYEYDEVVDEITERRFLSIEEIRSMIETHEISDGFTLSSLSIYFGRSFE